MKKRHQILIRTVILSMTLIVITGLLLLAQTRSNPAQAATTTRLVSTPSSSESEQQDGDAREPGQRISTTDHSKFEGLQQPFETGPDVTKACLVCHTEAAKQIHQTIHW